MVKLGFIVEGATEKIILEGSDFFDYLHTLSLPFVPEVINAGGNGNLLPHNVHPYIEELKEKGATDIFILTDLDEEQCITNTKERIDKNSDHFVVLSIRAVEAWFLSDTDAMRRYLDDPDFYFALPESVLKPFEELKTLRKAKTGRGFNDKKLVANTMVHKMGFSLIRASWHPACQSAAYFLNKIAALSPLNKS